MSPSLYLAPGFYTAIQHVTDQISTSGLNRSANLVPRSTIILPSDEAIERAWSQLGDTIGLRMAHFYQISQDILISASVPARRLGDPAARRLARQVLARLQEQGSLTTFSAVAAKPGFLNLIIAWLREVESQGIIPEQVRQMAETTRQERDWQLWRFYQSYQEALRRRNFVDAEGLLALAAQTAESKPGLLANLGQTYILGFDHFNPLQRQIISQLAAACPSLSVYLLWEPGLSEDNIALLRLAETRQMLVDHLHLQPIVLPDADSPSPELIHLRSNLFETGKPGMPIREPVGVAAVEAHSREAEVRLALQAIKRLLAGGVLPGEIGVFASVPGNYHHLVQAFAEMYALPVAVKPPPASLPPVAALRALLVLSPEYPWRETLDTLRSPYFRQDWLAAGQIDMLDLLSREGSVVSGLEQWRFALQPLDPDASDDDDDWHRTRLASTLLPDDLSGIEAGFLAFCNHITPPASASYNRYLSWLQEAILGGPNEDGNSNPTSEPPPPCLHMAGCCTQGAFAVRDQLALEAIYKEMRTLREAARLVPEEKGIVSWEVFLQDFLSALESMDVGTGSSANRIHFGGLSGARAATFEHIFILGLSEGEFPRSPAPDALYTPAERDHSTIPLLRVQPAESASLFWQAVANCRKQLWLSRPYLDENGAPWQPSPYWEEALAKVPGAIPYHQPVAAPASLQSAACLSEVLVAIASKGASHPPDELVAAWKPVTRAAELLRRRQEWGAPDEYEGVLLSQDLRQECARKFGPQHPWTASQLNNLGKCPFAFFAGRVLALDELPDPEEGFTAQQRGAMVHRLLEVLFRRVTEQGLAFNPASQERILAELDQVCADEFPRAPQRFGFRPGALWKYEQGELKRMLAALVAWECDPENAGMYNPFLQEVTFGYGVNGLPALRVGVDAGTSWLVIGKIDRIDRDRDGNLRVIDYKTGANKVSAADLQDGFALQTALYALAAQSLLAGASVVEESYYLHVTSRERSGRLSFTGNVEQSDIVQSILESTASMIEQARKGAFQPGPARRKSLSTQCRTDCPYSTLCRVDRHSLLKAQGDTGASYS